MKPIFSFFKEKQYRIVILLNVVIALLLLAYLDVFGNIASKRTLYFFVAPIFLVILFNLKNVLFKVTLPIFFLIFIENVIISSVPFADMFRIGGALIFAATALASILFKRKKEKLPKSFGMEWFLWFVFILISFGIGSTVSENLFKSNTEALLTYYIEFFLYFYLGYLAFNDVETLKKFLFILIILGLLSAIGHIFSLLTGINLESVRGADAVSENRDVSEGRWRYGGFFGNVNTMSAFYVMLIPASLYMAISDKSFLKKFISLLNILVMLISLLLGASRGGLLFVVLNMLIALFFIKIKPKNIIVGAIVIAVTAIVLNYALDQYFMEYFQRAIDEMTRKGTDSPRGVIWAYTTSIIMDYPFGLGLSTYNFSMVLQKYGNIFWSNPHNMYLEMITQTGFAGLIMFLIIVLRIIVRSLKTYKFSGDPEIRQSIVILFLMFTGFLMMGFTEPIFRNQYKLNHIFAILLGISLSLTYRFKNFNKNLDSQINQGNMDENLI